MNSVEALVELIGEAKSLNRNDSRLSFLRNEIEGDLEILEILKKHYNVNSLTISLDSFISFFVYKTDKDFEKIKEWLDEKEKEERMEND